MIRILTMVMVFATIILAATSLPAHFVHGNQTAAIVLIALPFQLIFAAAVFGWVKRLDPVRYVWI